MALPAQLARVGVGRGREEIVPSAPMEGGSPVRLDRHSTRQSMVSRLGWWEGVCGMGPGTDGQPMECLQNRSNMHALSNSH